MQKDDISFPSVLFVQINMSGQFEIMVDNEINPMLEDIKPFHVKITDDASVLTKEQIKNLPKDTYNKLLDYQKTALMIKSMS